MNLLRAQQTEVLDLFEEHFPRYYAYGSAAQYVRKKVFPRFAKWYSYTLTAGFVELDEAGAVRKILQKFRTMKKQSLADFQAPKKQGQSTKRRKIQPPKQPKKQCKRKSQQRQPVRSLPRKKLHDQTPAIGMGTVEKAKGVLVCDDVGSSSDGVQLISPSPKPTTKTVSADPHAKKEAGIVKEGEMVTVANCVEDVTEIKKDPRWKFAFFKCESLDSVEICADILFPNNYKVVAR